MAFHLKTAQNPKGAGRTPRKTEKPAVGAVPPENMNRKHLDLMQYFVENPGCTQREAAKALNMSESWVSILCSTDMFKAKLREVSEEKVSAALIATKERVEAVAGKSLDLLLDRLCSPGVVDIPTEFLLDAADKMSKRLADASGGRRPTVNVLNQQNNTFLASREELAETTRLIRSHPQMRILEHAPETAGTD